MKFGKSILHSFLITSMTLITQCTAADKNAAPEIGIIEWGRDYDAAFATAKKSKKPIFLLFQEVPG